MTNLAHDFIDFGHAGETASPQRKLGPFNDPVWGAKQLRHVSIFARFTDDELAMVYSLGDVSEVKPHTHLIIEGELARGMYCLLHGRLAVFKADPVSGNLMRLSNLEEGTNFGELSLFDNAPRSATVVAETVCYLFDLSAEKFGRFLSEAGDDLEVRFYKTCAQELASRFRSVSSDYLTAQQLLWKHALRKT